jgi:hypothetical protein
MDDRLKVNACIRRRKARFDRTLRVQELARIGFFLGSQLLAPLWGRHLGALDASNYV